MLSTIYGTKTGGYGFAKGSRTMTKLQPYTTSTWAMSTIPAITSL